MKDYKHYSERPDYNPNPPPLSVHHCKVALSKNVTQGMAFINNIFAIRDENGNIVVSGLERFLREGGGEVVKKATNVNDNQTAEIIEFGVNGQKMYYMKYRNCTPEPNWQEMSLQERAAKGLDEYGCKVELSEWEAPQDGLSMLDEVGRTFGLKPGVYRPKIET